jgi:hypothetical protein
MITFSAATQGFFIVRNRAYQSLLLLLLSFVFFNPGFFWDKIYPPLEVNAPSKIYKIIDSVPADGQLRVQVAGETLEGKLVDKVVMLQMPDEPTAQQRLSAAGLELKQEGKQYLVDNVVFGSAAEKAGIDFDWEIKSIQTRADRPPKQLMYGPAMALFILIYLMQRSRRVDEETFYKKPKKVKKAS